MSRKQKHHKPKKINSTIKQIEASRTGGQIALAGFTYQLLYSCYLALTYVNETISLKLEGVEDIDILGVKNRHIQVKQSENKKDAGFMNDVLKNFLEVYLLDNQRNFELVYDFEVARGCFQKLIAKSITADDEKYWYAVIEKIQTDNPEWNWQNFDFNDFIGKLSFTNVKKTWLIDELDTEIIKRCEITSTNERLFINGLMSFCAEKMKNGERVSVHDIDVLIQEIKDDISKGGKNPAVHWVKKIDFNKVIPNQDDRSYFEGKKATPADIVSNFPVRRLTVEKQIEDSINENNITIIKSSSGQGKTTLAWQVAYNLRTEYSIYQVVWCKETKEVDNIIEYIKTRIRMGEKIILVLDNLDLQLKEWNFLARRLNEEIPLISQYKIVVTTREDDWYSYSGDLSVIRSLKVVNISLDEKAAEEIYNTLQKHNLLAANITDWQSSWEKIEGKRLLIEYIYLLTHGEMLAERIDSQMKRISTGVHGKSVLKILRLVCFADICNIKIDAKKLAAVFDSPEDGDFNELLKTVSNEFLIKIDQASKYIEGLHPVRSQHIVDRLHEFSDVNDTVIILTDIVDEQYIPILFSCFPENVTSEKEKFYKQIVQRIWNKDSLRICFLALQGVFSGTVNAYYHENKATFDDANEHYGLQFIEADINPFIPEIRIISKMKDTNPGNSNIAYLEQLESDIKKINISHTDLYFFVKKLFALLTTTEEIRDLSSFIEIAVWLAKIDKTFLLADKFDLEQIWHEKDTYTIDVLCDVFFYIYTYDEGTYLQFKKKHNEELFFYVKDKTNSVKVVPGDRDIAIEYILSSADSETYNEESVKRINYICKLLPVFDTYSTKALSPDIEVVKPYQVHDPSIKKMPNATVQLSFNQDFAQLWSKTMMSHYECDRVYSWLSGWIDVRRDIITFCEQSHKNLCRVLGKKGVSRDAIDALIETGGKVSHFLSCERPFPGASRPFQKETLALDGFSDATQAYFTGIRNFTNQYIDFFTRTKNQRLARMNVLNAYNGIETMQEWFTAFTGKNGLFVTENEMLAKQENSEVRQLLMDCDYYLEHLPSCTFQTYQIKSWYENRESKMIEDVKSSLSDLSLHFSVVFSNQCYYNKTLRSYPIIVKDDISTDQEQLTLLLGYCTPVVKFDIQYLIIGFANYSNQVTMILKIPTSLFKAENTQQMEEIKTSLPIPMEPDSIDIQFWDCFGNAYSPIKKKANKLYGIDSVFMKLWEYSKYTEILTDAGDRDYLERQQRQLKEDITELCGKYDKSVTDEQRDSIHEMCRLSFAGEKFGDKELNDVFEKIAEYTLRKDTFSSETYEKGRTNY
jgi:hypothetical protein